MTSRSRPSPGERQYYNNSGYALLGCLIEKASGQDFATFDRENLLTPLNMKDSGIDTGAALVRHLAAGYDPAQQGFENAAHPTYTNLYQGAGALYSTRRDLLLWENGLFGGKVLASESLEKMTTPFRNNYAFGLVVRTFRGHKVIGHSGASDGVSAELDYYPGDKLTVVVLANLRFAPVGEIARHLARLAHGETVKLQSERREIPIGPAVLSRYAGAYQLNSGGKLLITVERNHLVSTPGGQAPVSFFPEAEHSFFRRGVDEQIEFPLETAAPAAQLVLHREEGDTTAKRLEEAEFRRLSEQADMAAKRFKEQKPYPGGDAVVRKLIDGLRAGRPDDAILAPSLFVGIRGQVSQLQALFAERGAIQSVEFQRVAPSGFDIYLIKADNGPLESQIWLAPDGKVSVSFSAGYGSCYADRGLTFIRGCPARDPGFNHGPNSTE